MNKLSPFLLGLSLAAAGGSLAAAQDQSVPAVPVPKYLQIIVEYPKPGKGGLAHDRTENAFVQAAAKANFPIHYIAFNALSGKPRAIFVSHFDSFDAAANGLQGFRRPGQRGGVRAHQRGRWRVAGRQQAVDLQLRSGTELPHQTTSRMSVIWKPASSTSVPATERNLRIW